jgi:cytochrome c oxidase subunit 4
MVKVWVALMGLLLATFGLAHLNLGPFNTACALAIAVAKAALVMVFFMHLKFRPQLSSMFSVVGFIWLALMIVGTLMDVSTRWPSPFWNG